MLQRTNTSSTSVLITMADSSRAGVITYRMTCSLFGAPGHVTHVHSPSCIHSTSGLFRSSTMPVSRLVTPRRLIVSGVCQLVRCPNTLRIIGFTRNGIDLTIIGTCCNNPLVNGTLSAVHRRVPRVSAHITTVFHRSHPVHPRNSAVIRTNSRIFFVTTSRRVHTIVDRLRQLRGPCGQVVLINNNGVNTKLTHHLRGSCDIGLVRHGRRHTTRLTRGLRGAVIFFNSTSSRRLLTRRRVSRISLFVTIAGSSRTGVVSTVLTGHVNTGGIVMLVRHHTCISLIRKDIVSVTVSPRRTAVSTLLDRIQGTSVINISSLHHNMTRTVRTITRNSRDASHIINEIVSRVGLPPKAVVKTIMHKGSIVVTGSGLHVRRNSRMVVFLASGGFVASIRELFRPDPFFLWLVEHLVAPCCFPLVVGSWLGSFLTKG